MKSKHNNDLYTNVNFRFTQIFLILRLPPSTPKMKIHTYFIGLGKVQFEKHLSQVAIELKDLLEVELLCDLQEDRIQKFEPMFKSSGIKVYKTSESYLDIINAQKTNPKMAVISTFANTHYEIVKECLEANCHVYVDKPLAFTPDEAKSLIKLSKKKKKHLIIGSQRKFESIYLSILEAAKRIGTIRKVHFHNHGNFPDATSENKENNINPIGMGYHLVDTLIWLMMELGKKPENLVYQSAINQKWGDGDAYIGFEAQYLYVESNLSFPATLSCSHLTPPDSVDEMLIITGDKGEVRLTRKESPRTPKPGKGELTFWAEEFRTVASKKLNKPDDKADRGAPLRHLIHLLFGNDKTPKSTAEEAYHTIKILSEIREKGTTI